MDNHSNTYVVIQPASDEKDTKDQIDEVFGSKFNSQGTKKPSLKLETGTSQLQLNDPQMDSLRGYDRASPYRPYETVSSSPLDSVFRGSLSSVREESYHSGYHQNLQSSFGNQDIRYFLFNHYISSKFFPLTTFIP